MAARPARTHVQITRQKAQRELEDLQLVMRARNGDRAALDALIRRYTGFVRLKASSYFLAGGDSEDLIQEGLIGLYKAVRDFRADKETSFRIVRRAVRDAADHHGDQDRDALQARAAQHATSRSARRRPARTPTATARSATRCPGPASTSRRSCVISTEELQSLVFCLGTGLSHARGRRAPPLPRGQLVRGDGRASSAATRRRSTTRSSA